MKIAIIGVLSSIGQAIAAECSRRGMSVTAIVPPPADDCGYPVLAKSWTALTAEDIRVFDAVIDALGNDLANTAGDIPLPVFLGQIMSALPEVRLFVVGGSGGLYQDDTRTVTLADAMQEPAASAQRALEEAFEQLRQTTAAWTYFRPAAVFDPKGAASGNYLLGRDIRILNPLGESYISYADYAAALADELEHKRFVGKAFTAVSDTVDQLMQQENNLINLSSRTMFTRCGSYMGVCADMNGSRYTGQAYQSGKLYIGTRRGSPTDIVDQGNEMVYLQPVYCGGPVGFSVRTSPTELTLLTAYGVIRLCFAEDRLLYIQGENGLALQLEAHMLPHEVMKPRGDRAWEGVFRWRCSLVLNPLAGTLEMDAPWDPVTLSTPTVRGLLRPDNNGSFLLAVEESVYAGTLRPSYPSYAQALADVTKDWETFLSYIPTFDESLEKARIESTWVLWSFLINPSGLVKRPHMLMSSRNVASSWQMNQNAVALSNNVPLSTDLLLNMIDLISPQGQLPDFVDDAKSISQGLHPPTQGWALKWIMRTHDIGKEIPHDKLEMLYDGYGKWADWFFLARDDDRDGIPQYDNGDESGFDDASPFVDHTETETPDLLAYLILLYDALADIADILGKPEEAAAWRQRSEDGMTQLLDTFWDGEHFIVMDGRTHEVIRTDSIIYYLPLVLGSKLPAEIVDKLTAELMEEGEYLSPFGLATEKPTSDVYRISGFSRGWVLPANNLLILTGMYDAGKVEEAKMIAKRYCDACARWNGPILLNPVDGGRGGFACSWSACTFLILADMLYNM